MPLDSINLHLKLCSAMIKFTFTKCDVISGRFAMIKLRYKYYYPSPLIYLFICLFVCLCSHVILHHPNYQIIAFVCWESICFDEITPKRSSMTSISSTFSRARFSYESYVLAAFLIMFWLWRQNFVRKKRAKMLMKLTPWRQTTSDNFGTHLPPSRHTFY